MRYIVHHFTKHDSSIFCALVNNKYGNDATDFKTIFLVNKKFSWCNVTRQRNYAAFNIYILELLTRRWNVTYMSIGDFYLPCNG